MVNEKSLANILSMSQVAEKYRVTMDTFNENCFVVHLSHDCKLKFTCHDNGLYYFDSSKINKSMLKRAFSFLNTVAGNLKLYKQREIKAAKKARKLQRMLCHPEQQLFIRVTAENMIRNNPVTVADVRRAENILGKSLSAVKGRAARRETSHVPDRDIVHS